MIPSYDLLSLCQILDFNSGFTILACSSWETLVKWLQAYLKNDKASINL